MACGWLTDHCRSYGTQSRSLPSLGSRISRTQGVANGFERSSAWQPFPFDEPSFVASLLANSEGSEGSDAAGSVSVKVRNLPGEELCNFQMRGETLQDLKRELSDPQGPMSKRLRTSSLNFYTVADPSKQLDLQSQVRTLSSELVIKQADVEDWLEQFPDVGTFLEAMRDNKFEYRVRKL